MKRAPPPSDAEQPVKVRVPKICPSDSAVESIQIAPPLPFVDAHLLKVTSRSVTDFCHDCSHRTAPLAEPVREMFSKEVLEMRRVEEEVEGEVEVEEGRMSGRSVSEMVVKLDRCSITLAPFPASMKG